MTGFRMPAEWSTHERTLMTWPCRLDMWGPLLERAEVQYAGVADAIVRSEPVTMVVPDDRAAARARELLDPRVELLRLPADDSWLRDNGPAFVLDGHRRRGVCFGFNAWGGKFTPHDSDAALAEKLVAHLGDEAVTAPLVLEGGSIAVDGEGTLVTTEQCLLHPNRNPSASREDIEQQLKHHLGVQTVVWLGQGLLEDLDTDGHVDLIAAFTAPGRILLQQVGPEDPNHENLVENRRRLEAHGIEVLPFPFLGRADVDGTAVTVSHLNLYVCNGAVIVPVAGQDHDDAALDAVATAFPGRDVVGVRAEIIAAGGGGPHCITQQVPAKPGS